MKLRRAVTATGVADNDVSELVETAVLRLLNVIPGFVRMCEPITLGSDPGLEARSEKCKPGRDSSCTKAALEKIISSAEMRHAEKRVSLVSSSDERMSPPAYRLTVSFVDNTHYLDMLILKSSSSQALCSQSK